MRKILFTLLCAFSALFFLPVSTHATDYTAFEDATSPSFALPLYMSNSTATSQGSYYYGSITQQIYYASDITTDFASDGGEISAISFWYKSKSGDVAGINRNIAVYLMTTDVNEYSIAQHPTTWNSYFLCDNDNKAGTKVYDGRLKTKETVTTTEDSVKLTFNVSNFLWDGTSNIVVTIVDKTGGDANYTTSNFRFIIAATKVSDVAHPRFAHVYWNYNATPDVRASWITDGNYDFSGKLCDTYGSSNENTQKSNRSYVAKATFSITPSAAPVIPSVPEDLAASSIGSTSASLSWSAVDGATSYDLYNSTSIDGVYSKFASSATNSYEWSELTASTTYYVKVAAVNDAGSSDYSAPISFTTLAPHIHDGITFEPWSNPATLPTSGNYFLNTDVAFDWDSDDVTLTGNLNLCLNGHEANLAFFKIIVPDGKTLAIFDNAGGGKITSFVASEVGAFDIYAKALIVVYNGAELDLHQGIIENTYIPDEDGQSYAIYSNGTLRLSGDVLINSNSADIYLYASNIITIDGAISNSEKHTIWKNGGAFTSGWSTYMSGKNPRDFFESANPARSVCLNEGEASLRTALNLSESSLNSAIGTYSGQMVDVNLTRSLTSSQFNTFCLPFALDDDRLQELFGAGYDLEEFVSSSLEDDVLSLEFSKVTSLEAGKPYLLKPSVEVTNPSFEGVTIGATAPVDIETSFIDFKGTFAPTNLEVGNRNILCLGASNSLFWPNVAHPINGFRAYFEVKGAAQKAKAAHIVKKEDQAQALDNIENTRPAQKRILNGQLVIEKNGTFYNAQGQIVK